MVDIPIHPISGVNRNAQFFENATTRYLMCMDINPSNKKWGKIIGTTTHAFKCRNSSYSHHGNYTMTLNWCWFNIIILLVYIKFLFYYVEYRNTADTALTYIIIYDMPYQICGNLWSLKELYGWAFQPIISCYCNALGYVSSTIACRTIASLFINLFTTIHDGNFRRHSSMNVTIKWHKFSSNIYYIHVFFVIWSWKLR